ncbi:MAG: hypothetical protein J6B64_00580 [Bacilli bacterium]|nr:hypothetical protein [Bacilli bacterium]MBP3635620.1 hypothetical protein [Bacilli bacterium]
MKVYSHRGESKYAPENTMSAFYLACFVNSDGIETDVRKTKDDVLVLIHDKTIDRTSEFSGRVSEYNYDDLLKMDFGTAEYKGEKIVKLSDFLKYFTNKKINIYLEIKESGYEKLIIKVLSEYNITNVTLISFKYDVLRKLRELSNKVSLGWLIYDLNDKVLNDCKEISLNHVLCTSICLEMHEVKLLKNNNFIVCAWGVLNKTDIKRLLKLGVDRIIYDSGYEVKKIIDSVDDDE